MALLSMECKYVTEDCIWEWKPSGVISSCRRLCRLRDSLRSSLGPWQFKVLKNLLLFHLLMTLGFALCNHSIIGKKSSLCQSLLIGKKSSLCQSLLIVWSYAPLNPDWYTPVEYISFPTDFGCYAGFLLARYGYVDFLKYHAKVNFFFYA